MAGTILRLTAPRGETEPLLQLLDLHGVLRSQVFGGVLAALKSTLLSRLGELSTEQLNLLLEKMFPYIAQPALSDAVMMVLQAHSSVPLQYLRALKNAPTVLQQCPYGVRHQVWRMDRALFASYVQDMLLLYCEEIGDDMLDRMSPNVYVSILYDGG